MAELRRESGIWVVDQPKDMRYSTFIFKKVEITVFEFLAMLSCLTAINVFIVSVVSESNDSQPNNISTTNRQLAEEHLLELESATTNCTFVSDISPSC